MTMTTAPHDPRDLARYLADRNMPGRRSMTAIRRVRRERADARPVPQQATTPSERLYRRLTAAAVAEIGRRGGETVIHGEGGRVSGRLAIADRDQKTGMILLTASGWRHYSSRHGAHRATLAYLYGADEAGPWAVRVPGTTATVAAALDWITPAEVKKARAAGRRVARQGDVYAVETAKAHDGRGAGELPEAHEWRLATRYLVHRPEDGRRHRPLRLAYPVRFVRQRVYGMGRNGGRAYGD